MRGPLNCEHAHSEATILRHLMHKLRGHPTQEQLEKVETLLAELHAAVDYEKSRGTRNLEMERQSEHLRATFGMSTASPSKGYHDPEGDTSMDPEERVLILDGGRAALSPENRGGACAGPAIGWDFGLTRMASGFVGWGEEPEKSSGPDGQ